MPHNRMHFHDRESKSDWMASSNLTRMTYLLLLYFKHNPLIQAQIALHFQLQKTDRSRLTGWKLFHNTTSRMSLQYHPFPVRWPQSAITPRKQIFTCRGSAQMAFAKYQTLNIPPPSLPAPGLQSLPVPFRGLLQLFCCHLYELFHQRI